MGVFSRFDVCLFRVLSFATGKKGLILIRNREEIQY